MNKKTLSFLLSILFAFSFQSNSNAMKRFLSACYTSVVPSCIAGEPDANIPRRMEKAEKITIVIKESSVLLGEMFKESLELAFKDSFEKVKTGLIKENKIGQELSRIVNQTLEEIFLLIFSRIDSTIVDIQKQPSTSELKDVVLKIFTEKILRLNALAKEKCSNISGQKKLTDIIIEFISSKSAAASSSSSAAAPEIDLKKVEQEVRQFVTKNAEQIKTSTDAVGFLVIILGRLAPMLPEIVDRLTQEIPLQFQSLIAGMGEYFAEQITIFIEEKQNIASMKTALCENIVKLLEEKIFAKMSEILKPYMNVVVGKMIEDFAPMGTHTAIRACTNLLVSKKLDGFIKESCNKIRTWLDTNNQVILSELNKIISQVIAVK